MYSCLKITDDLLKQINLCFFLFPFSPSLPPSLPPFLLLSLPSSLPPSLFVIPLASELVDWFIASGEAEDRAQAVLLGQLLVDTDYIHHVVDEHNFEDAYLFFRFRQDGE